MWCKPDRWSRCFFAQSESNWFLYVLILCCSYKPGFHENWLKGGTIQASWEACIVNIFPRCFICTFSGWKLFLFGPSTWFSFGWLWFLYYPEHLGPRLLFIAVWKQPILFLFTQFGPSLNLWTASNIHCHLTKLGLEYPEFWKAGLALPLVTQRAFQQDWL